MPPRQLFGTDGIRGVAGNYPLDERTVYLVGCALGRSLKDRGLISPASSRVLIGQDTRESCSWIADLVAGGLASEGIEVQATGVITTPGVAYLARNDGFAAGVMISASHNPYTDNGIKVFGHTGYKLPDEIEHQVEAIIFELAERPGVLPQRIRLQPEGAFAARYLDFLGGRLGSGVRLHGLHVVLDCANGAASELGPLLFRRLGARVTVTGAQPDGRNINLNCGSLHLAGLQDRVPRERADLGVAFDGDADRALFVTASGQLVDGDAVMYLAARRLKAAGRLAENLVVATGMSNLGLEKALARESVRLTRTAVGDKYVLEEMLRSGAALGGEQSGHVIFAGDQTTGDGLLTALKVCEAVVTSGTPLAELVTGFTVFPQKLKNVPVREKLPLESLPQVSAAIRRATEQLGDRGRLLVRYSGTENLARIMVEAEDEPTVDQHIAAIEAALLRDLGQG